MHAQTCLFGREKHDAGVHWTPRDYSRVNKVCVWSSRKTDALTR